MTVGVPELETERLRLRSWRASHLDPYAEMCANPRTQRWLLGVADRTEAWRRMALFAGHWQLRGFGNWALEIKTDGTFVGYAGLWQPEGWPEPEIMWALVEAHEGNGYATEAAARARSFALCDLRLPAVVSYISPQNQRSQAVARRLSAVRDGSITIRGTPADVWRHPANPI